MNTLLYFMQLYVKQECYDSSFHYNAAKDLYEIAEAFGDDDVRDEIEYSLKRFAERYCHNVYKLEGVPFWFYYFFCVLVDSSGGWRSSREFLCSMSPPELEKYFIDLDEELYAKKQKRLRDEYEASLQRKI